MEETQFREASGTSGQHDKFDINFVTRMANRLVVATSFQLLSTGEKQLAAESMFPIRVCFKVSKRLSVFLWFSGSLSGPLALSGARFVRYSTW